MVPRFFGQQIDVITSGDVKVPVAFHLGDHDYIVAEIVETWQDYGFGKNPLRRKRWWQRHHRNYYRIKTTEGEIFEIYCERGTKLEHVKSKKWFLYRQL